MGEHFPGLVTGYTDCAEALEQHHRAGQRVDQDPDHGVFDFLGWQPPASGAICSRLCAGYIVAIASAFFDGVRWDEPLAPVIDQQTRQQAWFGCIGLASMVTCVRSKLIPNSGPGLGVDQRRMLSRVELALVRNLTDVDRVRQQSVDVPAREGSAAALDAVSRRAALRAEPQAVGLLFDPAHTAEFTIKGEDALHDLGLGRVNDEGRLSRVVAEAHNTAHPHALLLRGGDLVADPFAGDLALELGKG